MIKKYLKRSSKINFNYHNYRDSNINNLYLNIRVKLFLKKIHSYSEHPGGREHLIECKKYFYDKFYH